jgi:S-adenosylmethionine:tRNA ribosyltransferase-isomerase
MDLRDLMFDLPQSLVAAHPAKDRAQSRLMVIERSRDSLRHAVFSTLGDFLRAGDLLVLNDTRVFPARVRGKKESGGRVEILLVEPFPRWRNLWIALIDAAKRPKVGSRIRCGGGVAVEVIGDMGKGRYGVKFHCEGDILDHLEKLGEPPLPPYVSRSRDLERADWERYQTVYASAPGAIAAPTAGFHFTRELLAGLEARGVGTAFLTLHVGPGTFQPVREEVVERHRMEGERYSVSPEAAAKVRQAKERGGRVIAVGSTTTRALEWIARKKGRVVADEGISRLYLYPGQPFRVIDGLITNFHLPASTPLLLVAAFAGLELIRRAYEEAVRLRYRFYSYGDAMLIL